MANPLQQQVVRDDDILVKKVLWLTDYTVAKPLPFQN